MIELFAWWNLIFLIPLVIGIIFALGAAFSLGDAGHAGHDVGHDIGHDVSHDLGHGAGHDGGHDGSHDGHSHDNGKADNPLNATPKQHWRDPLWLKLLGVVGIGKAPLTVVIMTQNLVFGGIGMIGNLTLGGYGFPLTLALACAGALVLGGRFAVLVSRLMPSTESYNVSRDDLIGRIGELTLPTDSGFGQVFVRDSHGDTHRVTCRADAKYGRLPSGTKVIIVDYDQEGRCYQAIPETEMEKEFERQAASFEDVAAKLRQEGDKK